ncbi:DUF1636 family protein [Aliisedimentitalea scapharcae]|uniref:DUF1636 family protein n=1 Tax=Aliisedimentitalea scapharcae TaxID=1524259 RepID=A0ABZ2XQX6_9RHOB
MAGQLEVEVSDPMTEIRTQVQLVLCTTCKSAADRSFRDGLQAALDLRWPGQVQLCDQACLNGCANPTTMALQGAGRATYFFAGVQPETDRSDILETVGVYLDAPQGWIEDARPCGRLRFCLKGRIAALC